MKNVLIKPLWPNGLKGKLFEVAYPGPLQKWRAAAAEHGIALNTWDSAPLDLADCIWFLDLPETRKEYEVVRKKARNGVPFVLQVMESPLARSANFHPENQGLFDYLVTYQQVLPESDRLFTYRLPNCLGRFRGEHKAFNKRKCAVMINTNRVEGWFATRKSGLIGLPGVGPFFSGWRSSWWSLFQPARGELYSWRRKLARLAEKSNPNILEIHGKGWNREPISWNPFMNRLPYRNRASGGDLDKLDLISNFRFTIGVENFQGNKDYISEKIFEPMMSGSVPVYLGDEKIDEVVPSDAFVDVRKFKNQADLLKYLKNCPESDWQKMYITGQKYLNGNIFRSFSTDEYVEKMLLVLKKVLNIS
jgi:hypothetical protein